MYPLQCPRCKNRSRFNFITQEPVSVKLNGQTGEIIADYSVQQINDPFHIPYQGPPLLVQCGSCSTIAEEIVYQKAAEKNPPGNI